MRRLAATALLALLTFAAPAAAQETHRHSGNMRHVLNLPYEARNGTIPNYGTDIEFARLAGKQYALAGSYRNGMQIVDISRPERANIAAVYDCGVTQGDIQVFRRADLPGRTFATYTSDTYGDGTSTCYRDAAALGFDVLKSNGTGKNGTFILEVTDPLNPTTAVVRRGPPGLAQPDRAPEREVHVQLELGPDHLGAARHRGHRHHRPLGAEDDRRAGAPDTSGPRHRVARHLVLQGRHARLLRRPLPGRDHRHPGSRGAEDHHAASSTRRSTSGTSSSRSRSPTRPAASASS